jgi:Tfp pilus assembly protein PilO
VFIFCFTFAAWSYFGYLRAWESRYEYQLSEFKNLQNSIAKLKRELLQYEKYKKALTSLLILENRLASQSSQVTMVEHINELARTSGVHVKASTFKHGKLDRGVRHSQQVIELNGQYYGMREFLKGLSSLPTLTVPVETKVEREKDSHKIKARIHLVSYQSSAEAGGDE